jgi:hypothetical protein
MFEQIVVGLNSQEEKKKSLGKANKIFLKKKVMLYIFWLVDKINNWI